MAADHVPGIDLHNATAVNVVALLKEPVGGRRTYDLRLDAFRLDADLRAEDVRGEVRLTRLRDQILADVELGATVELECARCLRPYRQPVETGFTEEYRPTVDVRTGVFLEDSPEDEENEDAFEIDEHHELDLAEALRQHILLALPMRPDCGEDCPGPDLPAPQAADEPIDNRFAALSELLADEP